MFNEIVKKYKVPREAPLPTHRKISWSTPDTNIDLATYEKEYPKSLFNKGVRAMNEDHVGHVMKDTRQNSYFRRIKLQIRYTKVKDSCRW